MEKRNFATKVASRLALLRLVEIQAVVRVAARSFLVIALLLLAHNPSDPAGHQKCQLSFFDARGTVNYESSLRH